MTEPYFDFKNVTLSSLQTNFDKIKSDVTNVIDTIVKLEGERSFENSIKPYIEVMTLTEPMVSSFNYVLNFYPSKELRDKATELDNEIKKFFIDIQQRKDFYRTCQTYYTGNFQTERKELTSEECRYVERMIRDFKRAGLHLDDAQFIEMKKTLSELETKFSKNINDDNTSFLFSKTELDGMPDDWFTDDKKVEENYKVTLKYPDYLPAMDFVHSSSVRECLYLAYNNRCAAENTPIFEQAVRLRYEIAKKLGYKTHAHYKTEVKVVKNPENALSFLNGVNSLSTQLYKDEMKKLLEFAQTYEKNPLKKEKLDKWDLRYYMKAYENAHFKIDHNEIKKYFPIDTVRQGLFHIYETLFQLKFEEVQTENKWHDDVQLFSVTDCSSSADSGKIIGYFYLDMFPREGKYSHAAAFNFMAACDAQPTRRPHIITMACNFPRNSCITFDDVETFFHEFGHVMHFICSKTQLSEFSGFGVEWDFVEAPSQMLEHWCYCAEPLTLMSKHTETNQPIPLEIVERIKVSKNVFTGYTHKRQLLFGMFDLACHMINFDETESFDARSYWNKQEHDIFGESPTAVTHQFASFGHLMGGYDAGYYGYLRSATYATNMFYVWFKKEGNVLNPEIGMRYRRKLLEPGSTKDGIELLEDFLGEKPNDIYYFIDQGLRV